jgi:energy-coupling factor transport system ATP-binding protein
MRPGVLVLDEPCANLDPDGVGQVHRAVRSLLDETGATLLVVEHRIGTWLDLVDRLVLVAPGGGVVADGAPAAVLAAHGPALTAAGVWVPGAEPAIGSARARAAADRPGGTVRVTASGASIGRGPRQRVADGIDLTVRGGWVLAVTGPNGVGKSTLGLTLGGLLAPSGGSLVAAEALADGAGATPSRWSSRQLAARIGTVFQDPEHQFVARTVREELAVGPRAEGLPDAEVGDLVDEVLDGFGLAHLADVSPFTLSGGEQRRLAIGTVVVTRPPVMILDEPTSGQDRATWQAVVDRLGALADAGTAVVLITHDRDLVRALDADELVLAPSAVPAARELPDRTRDPGLGAVSGTSRGVLRGVQPVALLLGVIALGVCLVTSLDVVSASVALVLELVLLPLTRVPVWTLLLRGIPILVAAPLAGLSIALYGRGSGRVWLDLGFAHVTDGSLLLAVATVLRLLAIGLPAVALFARVDPTDLGDGLAQVLRLPARFVLGALAALRMTTLLREDWQRLGMARRARGVADSGRIRRGASMAFALLVIALRRATALAVAMESRGFGARGARTWARPARFGAREWVATGVCTVIGLVGIGAAVLAGTWHGV